jgi:signal transduction histidine kinase
MLHEILATYRTELIDRCRTKVALRASPRATAEELAFGVPFFLEQLIASLRAHEMAGPEHRSPGEGPRDEEPSALKEVAALHGGELMRQGFTVDQVVHDYGDVCQAVTDLAFERGLPITVDEFRTLNSCLDNAIAGAVTQFIHDHDREIADRQAVQLNKRQGFLAHELRNLISTATLAVSAIKLGKVGLSGATGAVLDRSLAGLRALVDRSVSEVRATSLPPARHSLLSLREFIGEVQVAALLDAQARGCSLAVSAVDPELAISGDRDQLSSALHNLLQNAFKFTHHHSAVTLRARAVADRILIDVEDHCGGLPAGAAHRMFEPFTQHGENKSGLGLGLSISRRSVEASRGVLSVRDIPGSGCVFTIDLPRHALAVTA